MRLSELNEDEQVKVIGKHIAWAENFDQLDQCADLARTNGLWNKCGGAIHVRNMLMLGKVRVGYPKALYKSEEHQVWVVNEHAEVDGQEVHARQLCQRGYRFVKAQS